MAVSQASSFPWLYLTAIQEPPEIKLSINQWQKYGELRAQFLMEFQQKRESNPSQKSFNEIITKFFGQQPQIEKFEEMYIGHLFLRLAASINARFESWLRETEGDVFEYFFRQLSTEKDKLSSIQTLLGSPELADNANNIIRAISLTNNEVEKFNLISMKDKGWAIKYKEIPDIIGKKLSLTPRRRSLEKTDNKNKSDWKRNNPNILLRGYVFAYPAFFFGAIKKIFEHKLANEILKIKTKDDIDLEIKNSVVKYVTKLSKEVKFLSGFKTSFSNSILSSDKILFPQIDLYPPCMKYLRSKLEETGHLPHLHRVQLGIFLKSLGMDVDTQLHFWYETAIDNVNITFETFNRRAGYQIRHLYGLEGGRIDYAVPKCQTIISDYFCLFQSMNSKVLLPILESLYNIEQNKENPDLNEILVETENYRARNACSAVFKTLNKEKKFISHPLSWVRESMKKSKTK